MKNSFIVLMSTYNGEKYLREQLDSILSQQSVNLKLLIRDDGSSDNTIQIIDEYRMNHDNIVFLNKGESCNIGFNRSYLKLISSALQLFPNDQLFCFADQDDIWLPKKLIDAYELIKNSDALDLNSKPFYYYSNKMWVDEKLSPLHEDHMHNCRDNYFDMFLLPPVYGCASVFNRVLAEKTITRYNDTSLLYDVYMFRLNCLLGGTVLSDERIHMLYRRHGNNASGEAMKVNIIKYLFQLLHNKSSFHGIQKYVSNIWESFAEEIDGKQRAISKLILNYNSNFSSRLRLLFWKDAYTRGIKVGIIWIGRVLLGAL